MTWQAFAAFIAALAKAMEPYVPEFAALLAGRKWQQADDDADALKHVEASAKAASRVVVLPDSDVLHELKRRNLYRVSDEPAKRG